VSLQPALRAIACLLALGCCGLLAHWLRSAATTLAPGWSRRLIALFLILQALLLLIYLHAIFDQSSPELYPPPLWDIDNEQNIPSTLATLGLALLGALCLLIGVAARQCPPAERGFWLALGLALAVIALIEYETIPRTLLPGALWLAAGVSLAVAALYLLHHYRLDRRRALLALLVAGLGVWTLATFWLDLIRIDGVYAFKPLEETLEYLGVLLAFAGAAGLAATLLPAARLRRSMLLVAALLALLLFYDTARYHLLVRDDGHLLRQATLRAEGFRNLLTARLYARPLAVHIDETLALQGWHFDLPQPGKTAALRLWLHATRPLQFDDRFGIAVQLLDQERQTVLATAERLVRDGRHTRLWQPGRQFLRHEQIALQLPAAAPTNRAFWLTLSFWRWDGLQALRPLPVSASDQLLLGDAHIVLDEFVLPAAVQPADPEPARARFVNGFVLQDAAIPARARAGSELDATFRWRAEDAGNEDWTQFLHLVHEGSGARWNIDRPPLGRRLPTRLWYAGLQADESWRFTLPADLQPGEYALYTGLYRLADLQRLAVTLAGGAQPADATIPLGSIFIERQAA